MKRIISLVLIACVMLFSGCVYPNLEELEQLLFPYRIDYDAYTHISDLEQLRDYIVEQQSQDNLEISFVYTGESQPTVDDIMNFADACFVNIVQEGENYCLYHLTLTEFPGNRIVDAYYSGDNSALSEGEVLALQVATVILEDAKAQSENDFELEMAIYDILTQRITYCDDEIQYDVPENQPRHLNAVGALVDGQANCQGYADAFYTVASMAGFQVGRMGVDTPEDSHMVNTICLDGSWYVVDVTFADDETDMVDYRLLNAGKDMTVEFWWDESCERYPISETTSPDHYYYFRNQSAFNTQDEVINYFAEQWELNGYGVSCAMLRDGATADFDFEAFGDDLYNKLSETQDYFQYRTWYLPNEQDIFFTVEFSEGS